MGDAPAGDFLLSDGMLGDRLLGDGLLARSTCEAATPLGEVLRALEAEVLSRTGVAVRLAGKTLDGNAATEWPTRVYCASSAPEGSWWSGSGNGGSGSG